MAAKTDKKTLALIGEIQRQKQDIAKVDRPSWRTNCAFAYVEGSSDTKNIQVVSGTKDLVLIAAFLIEKRSSYGEAASLIGVENAPLFTWCGFTVEDWLEDLKLRISKIQIASKRKKLETLETRLNAVVSPELRAELELQAITDELSLGAE